MTVLKEQDVVPETTTSAETFENVMELWDDKQCSLHERVSGFYS